MSKLTIAAVLMLTAGCAQQGARPVAGMPRAIDGEEIRYATEACYGTCPVYTVAIRPDGSGTFTGERFTAVTGTRAFQATPDAYRRFAATLAPYKPAEAERRYEQGSALCGPDIISDQPAVHVAWAERSGALHRLFYYYGCGIAANRTMAAALRHAPETLPIGAFIGKR